MKTFDEFWPFYLNEHRKPATRAMHLAGTTVSLLLLVSAMVTGRWALVAVALVTGYGFAWVSHFGIEKNRPATFKYPLWSFAADWKMWACWLTRRLDGELQRAGVSSVPRNGT